MLIFRNINMKIKFELDQLNKVSIEIKKLFTKNIILMSGQMGVGKTTLIKSILESMNVVDNISSPTFSIINEYKTDKDDTIYHIDLFRLKDISEIDGLGLFECFNSGNLCFIEWPDLIEGIIDLDYNKFKITTDKTKRLIEKIR